MSAEACRGHWTARPGGVISGSESVWSRLCRSVTFTVRSWQAWAPRPALMDGCRRAAVHTTAVFGGSGRFVRPTRV
jgi:hypothetical protein